MVSDVLADMVTGLDYYLNKPSYADIYAGDLRTRLINLRNEARSLAGYLDTPPDLLPNDGALPPLQLFKDWEVWCDGRKISSVIAEDETAALKTARLNHPGLEMHLSVKLAA